MTVQSWGPTSSKCQRNLDPHFSGVFFLKDTKHVNYTQVTFSDPGGLENDSALDYENMKEATDYVNVNPKSHKPNLWTFVNPAVSEQVEYTQVAL